AAADRDRRGPDGGVVAARPVGNPTPPSRTQQSRGQRSRPGAAEGSALPLQWPPILVSHYPSRTVEKETQHTVSLIEPHLGGCQSVLDVGCGAGYVARELERRFASEVWTVDIG